MNNEDLEEEILNLKTQVAAQSVVALVQFIFIYILIEEIKLKKRNDKDPIKWERLKRLAIFGATCSLVVKIYYVYKAYMDYRNRPTANNKLFLIAAILSAADDYIVIIALKRTENGEDLYAQNF